jgi:hypothetical protein
VLDHSAHIAFLCVSSQHVRVDYGIRALDYCSIPNITTLCISDEHHYVDVIIITYYYTGMPIERITRATCLIIRARGDTALLEISVCWALLCGNAGQWSEHSFKLRQAFAELLCKGRNRRK